MNPHIYVERFYFQLEIIRIILFMKIKVKKKLKK